MSGAGRTLGRLTPIRVGAAITFLVALGFIAMSLRQSCSKLPSGYSDCQSNWVRFLNAAPNEIGDTLAGFAGVLAFVWIIVTVSLQSLELREQRKELELTRDELKLARQAQEKQLEVMQKQAEIFEDERRFRKENEAKEVFAAHLELLGSRISEYSDTILVAAPAGRHFEGVPSNKMMYELSGQLRFIVLWDLSLSLPTQEKILTLSSRIEEVFSLFEKMSPTTLEICKCDGLLELHDLCDILKRSLGLFQDLPEAERVRVQRLRLAESLEKAHELILLFQEHAGDEK